VRAALLGAIALLVGGAGLIVYSAIAGSSTVALLLVFPVVSGSSIPFLVGVLLVFVGFVVLPFALAGEWAEVPLPTSSTPDRQAESSSAVGGFVLIGPVPILFGSWKKISRRVRWLLALVGAFLLTFAFVAFDLLLR
jgi:uncharacterized protein (TIGR00304 family)